MPRMGGALCAALVASARAAPSAQAFDAQAIVQKFDKFSKDFGKNYTPEERAARLADFEANLQFIAAENSRNNTFELGLNSLADRPHAEMVALRLGLKRPNHTGLWGELPLLGTAAASGAATTLPASVDWRARGALPPVGDQGHCGACWTFSATASLSAAWQIETGILVILSQQQLMDCTGQRTQGCLGGNMDPAFVYAKGAALCTAESYPYLGRLGQCRASGPECAVGLPQGVVRGYRDVAEQDEAALMEAVAQQPVSVGIEAEDISFHFYKSGIYANRCGTEPNHGVLVVGYGTEKGTPYWLLRNSWGPDWGEDGYFKLLREPSGAGQCGIMTMPSYPIVRAKSSGGKGKRSTPAPAATTPPPEGGEHRPYGRPPCASNEVQGRMYGGEVCAPACGSQGQCPGVTVPGVSARPMCVLQDPSLQSLLMKPMFCALVCTSSSQCAAGAKCVGRHGSGICVYPAEDYEVALPLLQVEPPRRLSAEDSRPPVVFV